MPQRPPEVWINILVDPDRFDAALRALSDAGVRVEDQQRAIGTIGGRVSSDQVAALAGLDGVMAVEPETTGVRIPPPESDVQ